jgi:hypothetical protein
MTAKNFAVTSNLISPIILRIVYTHDRRFLQTDNEEEHKARVRTERSGPALEVLLRFDDVRFGDDGGHARSLDEEPGRGWGRKSPLLVRRGPVRCIISPEPVVRAGPRRRPYPQNTLF